MQFDFSKRFTTQRRQDFADELMRLSRQIGMRVSSRGWCYIMEGKGFINKNQFDRVDNAINDCRRQGLLPVDFVLEEDARAFAGVEKPGDKTPAEIMEWMIRDVLEGDKYYQPDWWEGEEYYIQVVVEKIDLKNLFGRVCQRFHIPIANSKGWSSILQRAEYARRFKEAEDRGLKSVLIYCGDHDPDGLRISDTIRKNLEQISEVRWRDGEDGYDPSNLIIDRIGLNYDFIISNHLTWIDNLITGSGGDLASPRHPNHKQEYVQRYLNAVGERKCEANALVIAPQSAQELIYNAIIKYVGPEAEDRFKQKRKAARKEYVESLKESGLIQPIGKLLGMSEEDIEDMETEGDDEDMEDDEYED